MQEDSHNDGGIAVLVRLVAVTALGLAFLQVPAQAASPTCAGKPATIVGTSGRDKLIGTPGDDVIVGLGGNDRIIGHGGNDLLCGDEGADRLRGGFGRDRLYGGSGGYVSDGRGRYSVGDSLWGGAGNDHFDGGINAPTGHPDLDSINLQGARSGVVFDADAGTILGQGHDTFTSQAWRVGGSAHDDVVLGGSGDDQISGNGGNDRLRGGGGIDILTDGPGNDFLYGEAGNDTLWATQGRDVLKGGPGHDALDSSGTTVDRLYGDDGDDKLADTVMGRSREVMDGGAGENELTVILSEGPDGDRDRTAEVDLATGVALVQGQTVPSVIAHAAQLALQHGRWTVHGTEGPDWVGMSLGSGFLHAFLLGGDDTVRATNHDDYLVGGDGTDKVIPAGGKDTCLEFEIGAGSCEVTAP